MPWSPRTDGQNTASRLARGLALGPALIVALTAGVALPQQAGGYRLAKWGLFGLALAVFSLALLALATAATLSKGGVLSLAAGGLAFALLDPRGPAPQRRARLAVLMAAVLACALATLLAA